ncbi:MAG: hypothetical protein R6V59_06490 [Dehalococcoidia bacterium]
MKQTDINEKSTSLPETLLTVDAVAKPSHHSLARVSDWHDGWHE